MTFRERIKAKESQTASVPVRNRKTIPVPDPRKPIEEIPSLSKLLDAADKTPEHSRDGSNPIHASALSGSWCARRHALAFRYPEAVVNRMETPSSARRLVWKIGRAVEQHIRELLLSTLSPERVVGAWRCACGASTREGVGISDFFCSVCKTRLAYGELKIIVPGIPVSGSPDIQILTGTDGRTIEVVEIKSEKLSSFATREAADATHEAQCGIYVEMLKRTCPAGFRVSDYGRIVYGAKDCPRPGVLPYKDYTFLWTKHRPDRALDRATRDLAKILSGDKQAPLPARLSACTSTGDITAKNCNACNLCFTFN